MPKKGLSMRRIRELLRLKTCEPNMSTRALAVRLGVAGSTVHDCQARLAAEDLVWPLPDEMTDEVLWKILRQHPPLAARAQKIENGFNNAAHFPIAGPSGVGRRGHMRPDDHPFALGQITCIATLFALIFLPRAVVPHDLLQSCCKPLRIIRINRAQLLSKQALRFLEFCLTYWGHRGTHKNPGRPLIIYELSFNRAFTFT
jgi:hypothetical protein